MDDLAITLWCAKALELDDVKVLDHLVTYHIAGPYRREFNPLGNDEDAMALVKKFRLPIDTSADDTWIVDSGWNEPHTQITATDLNRAICECVAKMEASK